MRFLSWLILVLLVVTVYGQCLNYPFVYDDGVGIQADPSISHAQTAGQAAQVLLESWRPATRFTYALTHALFGFSQAAFHVTNIIVHIINTLLVFEIAFLLARRWMPGFDPAYFGFAAAAIQAVHPLYTEAVTYISGRSSSLCALFYFACLFFVIRGLDGRNAARRAAWFCVAAAAGIGAWAAKEEAITLPFVVAILLLLSGYRKPVIALILLPIGAVAARWQDVAFLFRVSAENQTLANVGLGSSVNAGSYMLSVIKAAVFYYLSRFILPLAQSIDPYFRSVQSIFEPGFLIAAAFIAALAAVAWRCRFKQPLVTFSIAALLVSPLLAYAAIPLPDVVAEHRVYISGLGIDLLFAWILTRSERLMWPLLICLTISLSVATVMRNSVWKSEVNLWQQAAAHSPNLVRPHLNSGVALQIDGQDERAVLEYRQALAIQPKLPIAYSNMATIYLKLGRVDEAKLLLQRAIELSGTGRYHDEMQNRLARLSGIQGQ
jgi:tetratricopeptide (TPR) repeat protein